MPNPTRRTFLRQSAALSVAAAASGQQSAAAPPLRLWYTKPAAHWTEALPLGNGRIGAMVFGGPAAERFQLNDDTLYSNEPDDWFIDLPIAEDIRKLSTMAASGQYAEADRYITGKWLGRAQACYQPLADLRLEFSGVDQPAAYERSLDLRRAVAITRFTTGGVTHEREAFLSFPDQALVLRLRTNRPGALGFQVRLETLHPTGRATAIGSDELSLEGQAPGFALRRELEWVERNGEQRKYPEIYDDEGQRLDFARQVLYGNDIDGRGTRFEVRLKVIAPGAAMRQEGSTLRVENAGEAVLILTTATSFNGYDRSPSRAGMNPAIRAAADLRAASAKPYTALLSAHTSDYQRLFDRADLSLGSPGPAAELPTDQRIRAFAANPDPSLAALYFHFGRYLMIAGSRPGSQPLNLQGIWNDEVIPPWASAYTVNINAEMNYWLGETASLQDCHEPLFRMVEELMQNGRKVAQDTYGLPGWVAHHNTSIWRGAQPVDGQARASFWPMAGGWLARHLWDHYLYSGDRRFLEDRAWPVMSGAAEFLSAWLTEAADGTLVTPVGTSPENIFRYTAADGTKQIASVSQGPTMDLAIIRELFASTIAASKLLNQGQELAARLSDQLARLRPFRTGSKGQLLEWEKDFEEPEPEHRHVSHLYGLHPSNLITRRGTPDLFAASKRTLELRGDGGTGWSRAWKINFWARLEDGEHAWKMVQALFELSEFKATRYTGGGVLPNLFCSHPPFQIDGNFGGAAGIAEMLLQSHAGELHLLPAVPAAWAQGRLKGFRARGGFTLLEMVWQEGMLLYTILESAHGAPCRLRYREKTLEFATEPKARYRITGDFRKPQKL